MDKHSVFIASDNIISSLGFTTAENIDKICREQTGIRNIDTGRYPLPLSLVDNTELSEKAEQLNNFTQHTRLEQLMLLSVLDALRSADVDVTDERCVFVIATTKGNIDNLPDTDSRLLLWQLGEHIRNYFANPNQAIVISNACISGVLAVETAARMLRTGHYNTAVVVGGDLVSDFVISGFESFRALSDKPCKPYDVDRNGLTLGEGAATMILTCRKPEAAPVMITGGASSNDATHISAPDRTGSGLHCAISKALDYSGLVAADINALCAHGTATIYNDEMEAQAFHLAGLSETPTYSLKGYWGHTLGASGLMESVAATHSLRQQILFRTLGFTSCGTTKPLQITTTTKTSPLQNTLKTASGFGGCNAALILMRIGS